MKRGIIIGLKLKELMKQRDELEIRAQVGDEEGTYISELELPVVEKEIAKLQGKNLDRRGQFVLKSKKGGRL